MEKGKLIEERMKKNLDTYKQKNADYGDSFSKSFDEFGAVAGVVRINDKVERLKRLVLGGNQNVKDESILDTLDDLSNYALMLAVEIDVNNSNDEGCWARYQSKNYENGDKLNI